MTVKVDHYTISQAKALELFEAYGSIKLALDAAIDLARERARLYVMPCRWESKLNKDGTITVTRTRNVQR